MGELGFGLLVLGLLVLIFLAGTSALDRWLVDRDHAELRRRRLLTDALRERE